MQVAGGNENLFDSEAVELIWESAHGVPRIINTICDLSLVYGFSSSAEQITMEIAQEVIDDRSRMGLKAASEPVTSNPSLSFE